MNIQEKNSARYFLVAQAQSALARLDYFRSAKLTQTDFFRVDTFVKGNLVKSREFW